MSRPLRFRIEASVGALRLDVELETSGTLVVVGPNGAGKSSLFDCLLGVRGVERGRISVGEELLLDTEAGVDLPLEERRLGYVPQDYALFPHLCVRDNVAFAVASSSAADRRSRAERVATILSELGLEALADRRPHTLSGGERQRVALARALSVNPRALLLDEPLAALDLHARGDVRRFLAGYLARLGLPALMITHDPADARELGDRIAVLEAGKLTQCGTWAELVGEPGSEFVAALVASDRALSSARCPDAPSAPAGSDRR